MLIIDWFYFSEIVKIIASIVYSYEALVSIVSFNDNVWVKRNLNYCY